MIISLHTQDPGSVTFWRLGNINFQVFRELQTPDIISRYNGKSD